MHLPPMHLPAMHRPPMPRPPMQRPPMHRTRPHEHPRLGLDGETDTACLWFPGQVHAFEVLQGGCFNGDPHPGNVMLMPDGRLG